jgi:hypothetical protein
MVVVTVVLVSSKLKRHRAEYEPICYSPRLEANEHREKNLSLIYNSTDDECLAMLRMNRAPFFALCNLSRRRGLVVDTINSSAEEQVAMFLYVVGHNQRFRVAHQSFRRSIEIVGRHFLQVIFAVRELRGDLIKPSTDSTYSKILGSHRWNPVFAITVYCLGSIMLDLGSCFH